MDNQIIVSEIHLILSLPGSPFDGAVLRGEIKTPLPKKERKIKITEPASNIDHEWIRLASNRFAQITRTPIPEKMTGTGWAARWRSPLLAMLSAVIQQDGRMAKDLTPAEKYTWSTLGAVKLLIIDAEKKIKEGGLLISAPQSIEKIAIDQSREQNYLEIARKILARKGIEDKPVKDKKQS